MQDMSSSEIVTGAGRFSVSVAGSKGAPCALLLHGFPQSRHTWREVLPAVASAGYWAIAPDQRGYSAGVRPRTIADYTPDRLVGDVVDLFDALGVRHGHVVGHDWGGQIAWLTAAYHPGRVTSLCVLSRPHPAAFADAFAIDPEQTTRSGHHRAFQSPEITDTLLSDNCAALRNALSEGGVSDIDIDAYLEVVCQPESLDAALNWYRAAGSEGQRIADCPDVSVPTLYLWGSQDISVGRVAAELTAEHVTGPYRFVEVAGSGHFLTDDGAAPTVIAELLTHLGRYR